MIKVDISREKETATGKLSRSRALTLSNRIVGLLAKNKFSATIEIFLVSRERIKKLNIDFRRNPNETDVLSFPQNCVIGAKENVLGTVFISPEVAEERDEEIEALLEHGILHLLGFDHEKKPKLWREAIEKIKKELI